MHSLQVLSASAVTCSTGKHNTVEPLRLCSSCFLSGAEGDAHEHEVQLHRSLWRSRSLWQHEGALHAHLGRQPSRS